MKSSKNGSSKCRRSVLCPWPFVLGPLPRNGSSKFQACPLAQSNLRPGRVPDRCRIARRWLAATPAGGAVCRFGSPLAYLCLRASVPSPLPLSFRTPHSAMLFPVPRPARRPALIVAYSALCTPHSALHTRNSCSRLSLRPRVSPGFRHPVFRSRFPAFGSYPQRRMPIRPCHKPSNSSQNRSKGRRFPSKRDQKGAHFVMPILTFWGVTPSGASARAVLPLRKGHFGVVQGSKRACGKVIHKINKGEQGTGNRERGMGKDRESGIETRNPAPNAPR